jgi:UDP-2,3-diacylglucosamine pyrophosphatase LpxH
MTGAREQVSQMGSSAQGAQDAEPLHTIVVSDLHLCDAEPPHPHNPLWKRFKRRAHFVDPAFRKFLAHLTEQIPGRKELVLNGDIFDFDSVMRIPSRESHPELRYNWLEKARGLFAEEPKSRIKLEAILDDHPDWLAAVREFVLAGNDLVFVIGNHDIELLWPACREELLRRLQLPSEAQGRVRFCEWFYISQGDTLIEHGHQYDPYSLSANPIHPVIRKGSRTFMRIPFGNLAGRFILNGMGLMNPHANASFIKESFGDYIRFYFKYLLRTQPLILFTYLWSAAVTLFYTIEEGLLPAMRDPLTIDSRIREIATRAKGSPAMVLALREMHAHPANFSPLRIARELWLDRILLLAAIVFISFEIFVFMHWAARASALWFAVPLLLFLPPFLFYARSVNSEVAEADRQAFHAAPMSAQICGVTRVVHGHTHLEKHTWTHGVEVLNTGTWSYAYRDVECTEPYGRRCFAWIRSQREGERRVADLFEWTQGEAVRIEATGLPPAEESSSSAGAGNLPEALKSGQTREVA